MNNIVQVCKVSLEKGFQTLFDRLTTPIQSFDGATVRLPAQLFVESVDKILSGQILNSIRMIIYEDKLPDENTSVRIFSIALKYRSSYLVNILFKHLRMSI